MHIECREIHKRFGRLSVLDRVTFTIEPGQIVALLGLNGAGKTTLLRILAGIVRPTHGAVYYDHALFERKRIDLRQRLMFLPDYPAAFPEMTPLQHAGMVWRLYGRTPDRMAETVAELFQEFDVLPFCDTPLQLLSRGQAYKATLCAAIALNPEIWLLDEPFASGMDPLGVMAFKRHARQAAAAGRIVFYSTQLLDVAERFCDRVCVLHKGRVEAFDTLPGICSRVGRSDDALTALFQQLREAGP